MEIRLFPDAEATAREASSWIAAEARAAVAARGRFLLAVSGGRTPGLMLHALATADIPWKDVHVVQVDERVAPAGDPERNLTQVRENLLARAPLAAEQVHAMPVESPDLDAAAVRYAETLREIAGSPPVLDLVHLGLGTDGHTASLVPGDPALEITDRDVTTTGVYGGRRRMTLAFPTLNRARRVLWLVTGSDKVGMLARLVDAERSIPAGRIRQERALVLADRAAVGGEGVAAARISPYLRLGIVTDHGGFALERELIDRLRAAGHEVVDFGAHIFQPGDDYPDYVIPLARAVAAGEVERGIAICGSGVGASVCASKVPGVRAALIHDPFSARQGVADDHMNLLCLGGWTVGPAVAWEIARAFLAARFSHAQRHLRRLAKVASLEPP